MFGFQFALIRYNFLLVDKNNTICYLIVWHNKAILLKMVLHIAVGCHPQNKIHKWYHYTVFIEMNDDGKLYNYCLWCMVQLVSGKDKFRGRKTTQISATKRK